MYKDIFVEVKDTRFNMLDKYTGKHVAIIKGKICGWGDTVIDALKMAQEKFPCVKTEEILLKFVPQKDTLIL